jgi:pantothenate kinase-related protein Tda10
MQGLHAIVALVEPLIERAEPGRCFVLGIAGPPGGGKSTLALALCEALAPRLGGAASACVSLDDFYLPPDERRARGHEFRAPPGTHDLALLDAFLRELGSGRELAVPRYDREHERRAPAERVRAPVRLCVFEGWFVGARLPGYEALASALGALLYLDMALEDARLYRLERERRARESARGGMDAALVERYWAEVLAPGCEKWVWPLRASADLVVTVDRAHEITSVVGQRIAAR